MMRCAQNTVQGTEVGVLGLLFLTNVELLGGSLTLGEGVAINPISMYSIGRN